MLTIGLLVFLYAAEDRRWLKRLGWIALALVIAQGVLGGLTVLYLLPKPVSIAHACTAQVFFSLTCAIALFTSPSWRRGAVIVEDQGWPSLRTLAVAAPVLILVQIALGAAFRHRALGLMPHVIGAILIGAAVMMISVFVLTQFPKHSSLRRAGLAVLVVTGVQILMGIAAYLARLNEASSHNWMIFSTVTHVALGGLTMGLTVLQMLEVLYHVRRPAELAATEAAAHSR
jgi:cytochrome c oxidase assembly protein subunit 15